MKSRYQMTKSRRRISITSRVTCSGTEDFSRSKILAVTRETSSRPAKTIAPAVSPNHMEKALVQPVS